MTENHDYNVPEIGSSNWGYPLNENLNWFDTDIEIRDLDENRNDYTAKENAKYLATDTGNVYLGDGESWNKLGQIFSDADAATGSELENIETTLTDHTDDGGAHIGSGSSPPAGQFSFDGEHIYAGTGGVIRNLTNIGTGSGSGGVLSSIPADVEVTLENEDQGVGAMSRPLMGDVDTVTLFCSPNGTNDAAGTESDPISLEGALNRIPYILNGVFVIDLYTVPNQNGNIPAIYDTPRLAARHNILYGGNTYAELLIRGNEDNADDVVIRDVWNCASYNKGDHYTITGVRFESGTQLNGYVQIANCKIFNLQDNNDDPCIDSKLGNIKLQNTTVGSGNVSRAIATNHHARFGIETCTFHSVEEEFDIGTGSVLNFSSGCPVNTIGKNLENADASELADVIHPNSEPTGRIVMQDMIAVRGIGDVNVYEPSQTFDK